MRLEITAFFIPIKSHYQTIKNGQYSLNIDRSFYLIMKDYFTRETYSPERVSTLITSPI